MQPQPPAAASTTASGETRNDVHLSEAVTFSVGVMGGVGAAFIDQPSDQSVRGQRLEPEYPGFAGLNTNIGLSLELRVLGYVGVELDILSASREGNADMTVTNVQSGARNVFVVRIGHGGIQVPLLFKVAAPGTVITPLAFIGPMFVLPGDEPDFALEGINNTPLTLTAHNEDYVMFAFGVGVEFNLPIKALDLRIPLNVRGGYYPGQGDSREERASYTPAAGAVTEESYTTTFGYTVTGNVGLAAHF